MIQFHGEHCRTAVRDNGETVKSVPLPSIAYESKSTKRLSSEYDVRSHSGGIVPSTMGDANPEAFAGYLFRFYQAMGCFVGISTKDAQFYADILGHKSSLSDLLHHSFLEKQLIEGVEVLFPTETFMENQKVEKIEH